MIQASKKVLTLLCCIFFTAGLQRVFAQRDTATTINTVLTTHSKDGIFSSVASYTFEVNNAGKSRQKGKVSYLVTTEAGKKVKSDSVKVSIGSESTGTYNFDIPGMKPGFYKVSFIVNVAANNNDDTYDDTTRKAFGIKPDRIRSQYAKPADFDEFWEKAKKDLAAVKPEYVVTEQPDSSKDNRRVFKVEMKSLGGLTIRGYLTEPKDKSKYKKFAVLLALPGYQVSLGPMSGNDPDMAIFTLNIRGQGNSRDVIDVRRQNFILLDLEDKNRYVMRGAIMDCVRAVDFICSRPELRSYNIIASGGSLGGFLAVATSAVDKRISFCSAANPIFCDVRNLVDEVKWPINDIKQYVKTRPGLTMEKVMDNLDYFDTKNFASELKCPTLVGIGLVDDIAPPNHVYTMYNEITAPKHLIVFRDLGHEIGIKYAIYEGRWMRDTFALF